MAVGILLTDEASHRLHPGGDAVEIFGESIREFDFVEEFPGHDGWGISPAGDDVAELALGESDGLGIGEELFGLFEEAAVGFVPGILPPVGIGIGAVLAVMLEDELKVNAAGIGGGDDLVPQLCGGEAQLAGLDGIGGIFGPVEIFAVPMAHPDSRPIHASAAHARKRLAELGLAVGTPGKVVADWVIRRAIAEGE